MFGRGFLWWKTQSLKGKVFLFLFLSISLFLSVNLSLELHLLEQAERVRGEERVERG